MTRQGARPPFVFRMIPPDDSVPSACICVYEMNNPSCRREVLRGEFLRLSVEGFAQVAAEKRRRRRQYEYAFHLLLLM